MFTVIEMRKRYLIYIRAMLSLIILLIAIYHYTTADISVFAGFFYVVSLLLSNAVFIFLPARLYKGIKLHYLVFLMDLAFIVIAAFIFTRMDLTFIVLIFLTVFISALSQSVGLSLVIAVVVNSMYIFFNSLQNPGAYNLLTDTALLNLPFIFVVALHSSYLAEKANEVLLDRQNLEKINLVLTKKVISRRQENTGLINFTECLLNGFKFGVLMLDAEGIVQIVNKTAAAIIGLDPKKTVGFAVKDINIPQTIKDAIMNLQFKGQEINEAPIDMGGYACLVSVSFITSDSGEAAGILCTLKKADK